MRSIQTYGWALLLILIWSVPSMAQSEADYQIQGRDVILTLTGDYNAEKRDSFLLSLGFTPSSLESLVKGTKSPRGWIVESVGSQESILIKSLDDVGQVPKGKGVVEFMDKPSEFLPKARSLGSFGYQRHPLPHIQDINEQTTRFSLKGHEDAKNVYLSGDFNEWSTLSDPMVKTNDGWEIEVNVKPGVWGYKFIVDGKWMTDPKNKDRVGDGHGNLNSRYVKANHVFRLDGRTDLRKVFVSGNFNWWSDDGARMRKRGNGWELPVYLADGTWYYKFVLPGDRWILDPKNPYQQEDGVGNYNSMLSFGDTVNFQLSGHLSAKEVVLSGNFVGWSKSQLQMKKFASGWELPYVLGDGLYEYKFIVDGEWVLDPKNAVTVGQGDYENNVMSVGKTYRFSYTSGTIAEEVRLSGNFNGWANPGYTMIREGKTWFIDVFLHPGKHRYKFVVDGKWMTDPINSQKERNEFNEYNSVLWVRE